MGVFRYTAIDPEGNRVSATLEAADPDELVARLTSAGLHVESVQAVRGATSEEAPGTTSRFPAGREEFGVLSGHVAALAGAGLPLESGLRALAAEFPGGRTSRTLRGVADRLESGADLEAVLEGQGAPADLRALLRAGLRSGRMGDVLEQYVRYAQSASEMRRRVRLMLAYPLVMSVIALVVLTFFLVWLVPEFSEIFADFGIQLPTMTAALIAVSQILLHYGWLILIGIVVALVMLLVLVQGGAGGRMASTLASLVPVLGSLYRSVALAKFSRVLALLVRHRVPLTEALTLSGEASGDHEVRAVANWMAARVEAGEPLSSLGSAARGLRPLPSAFLEALNWEEYQDAFPDALEAISDVFERQARVQAAFLAAVTEPIIMTFLGGLLGFVVLALFLPLIKLLNGLS